MTHNEPERQLTPIDEIARRVQPDEIRAVATQHPHLKTLLDELDAMYAERREVPPDDWQAPTNLQRGIDLYVAEGANPDDARTHFYRQWLVGQTDRGLQVATELKRGVDAARRRSA